MNQVREILGCYTGKGLARKQPEPAGRRVTGYLPCHPPYCWLRLFSSQTFSRITPQHFSNLVHSSHLPDYEDGTVCSETSAYKIQTSGNYPEEGTQQVHSYLYALAFSVTRNICRFALRTFRVHLCSLTVIIIIIKPLVLTEESAVDLDSCLRWEKRNVPSMLTVTDTFQLKIHLAEVHSHFEHFREYSYFLYCHSVQLELCTHLTLGLSQTKKNTTSCSDKTIFFTGSLCFPPTDVVASIK